MGIELLRAEIPVVRCVVLHSLVEKALSCKGPEVSFFICKLETIISS